MASFIPSKVKKLKEQKANSIISAAAKIIKGKIRQTSCDKSFHPLMDEIENIGYGRQFQHASHIRFGHCISWASRPKSTIAPITLKIMLRSILTLS